MSSQITARKTKELSNGGEPIKVSARAATRWWLIIACVQPFQFYYYYIRITPASAHEDTIDEEIIVNELERGKL